MHSVVVEGAVSSDVSENYRILAPQGPTSAGSETISRGVHDIGEEIRLEPSAGSAMRLPVPEDDRDHGRFSTLTTTTHPPPWRQT